LFFERIFLALPTLHFCLNPGLSPFSSSPLPLFPSPSAMAEGEAPASLPASAAEAAAASTAAPDAAASEAPPPPPRRSLLARLFRRRRQSAPSSSTSAPSLSPPSDWDPKKTAAANPPERDIVLSVAAARSEDGVEPEAAKAKEGGSGDICGDEELGGETVVRICRVGAAVRSLVLPDGTDVVLGSDETLPYLVGGSFRCEERERERERELACFAADDDSKKKSTNDGGGNSPSTGGEKRSSPFQNRTAPSRTSASSSAASPTASPAPASPSRTVPE